MNKIFLVLVLLSSTFLFSCVEEVTGVELPYVEQIVINAKLTAGQPIENISISKTIPTLEEYDYRDAILQNAEVTITVNQQSYTLLFNEPKLSFYTNEIVPEIGKTYKIDVRWKGLHAYADTYIPDNPEILSFEKEVAKYDYGYEKGNVLRYSAILKPKQSCAILALPNTEWYYEDDNIYKYNDTEDQTSVAVYQYVYLDGYPPLPDTTRYQKIIFETFDIDFYKYYTTRYQGDELSVFGSSGLNVQWNVKGDGIGMFIGCTRTEDRFKPF